jgi:uncharacterized small protein (DUF1192 family)
MADGQKIIAVLENQRNMALTLHVQAEAMVMEQNEQIKALQSEIEGLKAKLAELEKENMIIRAHHGVPLAAPPAEPEAR